MKSLVCFNGAILPEQEVLLSPLNRGMMYGDGCFETLKSYAGRFLDFNAHYLRLQKAHTYLGIDFKFSKSELLQTIAVLLKVNNLENDEAIIRFQSWRIGTRGYKTKSEQSDWIISIYEIKNKSYNPLHLITAKTRVIPSKALSRSVKLSNGLNYIIAAREAEQQRVDDALMLTIDEYVSETTISNIFWGKENIFFTPSIESELLPGITRKLILKIIEKNNFTVEEGLYHIDDIKKAEFAFTTNSISEIRAIQSLDQTQFDINHPQLIRLKSLFEALKKERLKNE